MAELTREQIEQVYSNFEKVIDCSPVHEGKAEARKCLRMVTDLALSALDARGGEAVLYTIGKDGKPFYDAGVASKDPAYWDLTQADIDFGAVILPLYTHPSPAAVQALREAREDLSSHRMAWRDALEKCKKHEPEEGNKLYWEHELRAYDRTFEAILKEQP